MHRPLVIIPTFNESANVREVIDRALAVDPTLEVLVVDDSSPDGTAQIVESLRAAERRIHLLERPRKAGLGSAYRDGFRWGMEQGFDVLVEMDADLSHDPSAIPSLLDGIRRGADAVVGSRYVPGGSIPRWSWMRSALSRYGNAYANRMLRLRVADATSGFRAFRADALRDIEVAKLQADGYAFQIETVYRLARRGGKIDETPIIFTDRTDGVSKMSSRVIVEALLLVTRWGIRDRVVPRRG